MPKKKEKGDDDEALAIVEDEDGEPIFDQSPVKTVCPHCRLNIITFIEHEASWVTIAVCLFLLIVLNWASLCVVPIVYPLFKDVVHHCPRCLKVLAARSRVVLPNFKSDVMTFRFGSCVVVLARKYVLILSAILAVVGGFHLLRGSNARSSTVTSWHRGPSVSLTWADFQKDCGFSTYLGNPIHVAMAFEDKFKNNTVHWRGKQHHQEQSLFVLPWALQQEALFVRMDPAQYPYKRDAPADLVLLYNNSGAVAGKARALPQGSSFEFDATMIQVGKRGAPHMLVLWDLQALTEGAADGDGSPAARKIGQAASNEGH